MYKNVSKNISNGILRSIFQNKEKEEKKPKQVQGAPKEIKAAARTGHSVQGYIATKIKGGYRIKLINADAFCPFSEFPRGFSESDILQLINRKTTLNFKIIKAENVQNIIVSRTRPAQEEGLLLAEESLKENKVIIGKITAVKEYGAFVDIGGIDGLVHISKIPNGLLPNEKQKIKVKVLSIDVEKKRISLSAIL